MLNLSPLKQFRETLYSLFPYRRDSAMNLLDALCSDGHRVNSPVELSMSPHFERQYSSVTDVVENLSAVEWNKIGELIYKSADERKDRVLLVPDATPQPRPYAKTLLDRHVAHAPNPAPGNRPICVGHQYAAVTLLPLCNDRSSHWVMPLEVKRVTSKEKAHEVGMQQIGGCIDNLSLNNKLVISVADSAYSTLYCRHYVSSYQNWVHLCRLNSARNIYSLLEEESIGCGNKKRYGQKMKLNAPSSHREADANEEFITTARSGKNLTVRVRAWYNQVARGSGEVKGYAHPMTVICVEVYDKKKKCYKRPLWLALTGSRRDEITLREAFEYYRRRYDIEHFFRFGKNKLLLAKHQTPDVEHEEAWWRFVFVAYAQLYLARTSVTFLPKPWERYLPRYKNTSGSYIMGTPSETQRGLSALLEQIGTPAKPCIPRGNPKGRPLGAAQKKRQAEPIVFKKKRQVDKKKSINADSDNSVHFSESKKMKTWLKKIHSTLQKMDCSTQDFYNLLLKAA